MRCRRATIDRESAEPASSSVHRQFTRLHADRNDARQKNANLTMTATVPAAIVNDTPYKKKTSGTNLHSLERVTPDFQTRVRVILVSEELRVTESGALIIRCHFVLTRLSQELLKGSKNIVKPCESKEKNPNIFDVTKRPRYFFFSKKESILGRSVSAEVAAVPL